MPALFRSLALSLIVFWSACLFAADPAFPFGAHGRDALIEAYATLAPQWKLGDKNAEKFFNALGEDLRRNGPLTKAQATRLLDNVNKTPIRVRYSKKGVGTTTGTLILVIDMKHGKPELQPSVIDDEGLVRDFQRGIATRTKVLQTARTDRLVKGTQAGHSLLVEGDAAELKRALPHYEQPMDPKKPWKAPFLESEKPRVFRGTPLPLRLGRSSAIPVSRAANKMPSASAFYTFMPSAVLTAGRIVDRANQTAARMNERSNLEDLYEWKLSRGICSDADDCVRLCETEFTETLRRAFERDAKGPSGEGDELIRALQLRVERALGEREAKALPDLVGTFLRAELTSFDAIPKEMSPSKPNPRYVLKEAAKQYCDARYGAEYLDELRGIPGCRDLKGEEYGRWAQVDLENADPSTTNDQIDRTGRWNHFLGLVNLDTGEVFPLSKEDSPSAKALGVFDQKNEDQRLDISMKLRFDPDLTRTFSPRSTKIVSCRIGRRDREKIQRLMGIRKRCGLAALPPRREPTKLCGESLENIESRLEQLEDPQSCLGMGKFSSRMQLLAEADAYVDEANARCTGEVDARAELKTLALRYNTLLFTKAALVKEDKDRDLFCPLSFCAKEWFNPRVDRSTGTNASLARHLAYWKLPDSHLALCNGVIEKVCESGVRMKLTSWHARYCKAPRLAHATESFGRPHARDPDALARGTTHSPADRF